MSKSKKLNFAMSINNYINSLNNSKFFAGLIMIILNIGSRYIELKFSKTQESYLRMVLGRQLLIFAVAWMGTRDIYLSLIVTLIFTLLADFALNENSNFCLLPETFKTINTSLQNNNDIISEDDINKTIQTLEKLKVQKRIKCQNNQYAMLNQYK
jgi:hypothetical protein|tara:strand:+ start:1174 stop:1638 length:465 start_codon:yes stop_codon:yes gene_type:complete